MSKLPGRIGTLTARDIMKKNVIVVAEFDTIETAVETLKKNRGTGCRRAEQVRRHPLDKRPGRSRCGFEPATAKTACRGAVARR